MSKDLATRLRAVASAVEVTAAASPWHALRSFIAKQSKDYDKECSKLLAATGKDLEKEAKKYGALVVKDQAFQKRIAEIQGRPHEWTIFQYAVETDIDNDRLKDIGTDVLGARMRGLVSVDSGFGDTKGITMRLWHSGP